MYEFFHTNYFKCSNDFAADCKWFSCIVSSATCPRSKILWDGTNQRGSHSVTLSLQTSSKRYDPPEFWLRPVLFNFWCSTVGSKIIRALAIILAIFLWFKLNFWIFTKNSSHDTRHYHYKITHNSTLNFLDCFNVLP